MRVSEFATVFGVDFSGAKQAGRNIWIARTEPRSRGRLALVALDRLEALCGTAERAVCLAELVRMVNASDAALWGIDCPFGLPIELFPADTSWTDQFAFLEAYGDDAYR